MIPYAVPNCPRAQYDSIEAINQSRLKVLGEQSPAHFRYAATAPRKPPSKPMVLGCLVEHLTLGTEFTWEPMRFDDFRTDEAKAWKKDFEKRGIAIVDGDMLTEAQAMTARVKALPEFEKWKPSRQNVALVGVHEPTGLAMKGLADDVPNNELVIVDLKTTDDASEWGFGKKIVDYSYDIQAWWYQNLWRQVYGQDRDVAFFCVESEPPYEPSIQIIKQDDIDRAGRAVDKWMAIYAECLRTDTWPGYPQGLTYAKLPDYRFRDV